MHRQLLSPTTLAHDNIFHHFFAFCIRPHHHHHFLRIPGIYCYHHHHHHRHSFRRFASYEWCKTALTEALDDDHRHLRSPSGNDGNDDGATIISKTLSYCHLHERVTVPLLSGAFAATVAWVSLKNSPLRLFCFSLVAPIRSKDARIVSAVISLLPFLNNN